ncbi:MAG: hypothetical protein ACJ75I_04675 [Solirubrobacterales bacterium]
MNETGDVLLRNAYSRNPAASRASLRVSPQPTSFTGIRTRPFAPEGVAVDSGHVYWPNQLTGTIGRADLNGQNPNQSFITGVSGPFGVAVGSG